MGKNGSYLGDEYLRALTASGAAGFFEIVDLPSVRKETDMSDLIGLASAGLAMIVSFLTVERSLVSVLTFTASALRYFSP